MTVILPAAVLNSVSNISKQDVVEFFHENFHTGKRLLIFKNSIQRIESSLHRNVFLEQCRLNIREVRLNIKQGLYLSTPRLIGSTSEKRRIRTADR